jgi:hypothetical protein
MFFRQAQRARLLHSLVGVCLVLLFSAFGTFNAVDNIRHFGTASQHEHSVLSQAVNVGDHDHHGDEHDHDGKTDPSPPDHPEHAHPNVLGSAALNDVTGFDAPASEIAVLRLIPPHAEGMTGHIQQTPDRPPKNVV